MRHRSRYCGFAVAIILGITSTTARPLGGNHHEVKHVIMMVPDGMGLADVTATRILRNCEKPPEPFPRFCAEGPGGPPLNLETLEHIGYQRTYSKTNTITDSSAAASAFACGEKFVNNEVCFHADGAPHNLSLLELAKSKGMATGLVATQTITHATPASFASHLDNRNCETEIARQYIVETRPDVLLGGGQETFKPSSPDPCGAIGDYISAAKSTGYSYVDTKNAMDSAAKRVNRLLGLFAPKSLTPEYLRTSSTTQPRLPDMTDAALKILDRNKAGFFLMVEGSLIDSGNHAENLQYQYGETKAFDQAVKVVLDWIKASPERQQHTLLIVLPDHETGGFAVKGMGIKGGELPNAGLGPFTPGWAFTLITGDKYDFESHHTGGDVVIWSQGPGSEALGRGIDNTFVYEVVKNALKL
jgi:alkaline phosphatase